MNKFKKNTRFNRSPQSGLLDERRLTIVRKFRFNQNIIERNKKAFIRKKSLYVASRLELVDENEPIYLNFETGKFQSFVPEKERLKLHHFLSSPILHLASPAQSKIVLPEQFKEFKAVRNNFMTDLRKVEKDKNKEKEEGEGVRPEPVVEKVRKQIVLTERDKSLISSQGRFLTMRKRPPKRTIKQVRSIVNSLRNSFRALYHLARQVSRFESQYPKLLKGVSSIYPTRSFEHPYSSSFFQLVSLSKRHFSSTQPLILLFLKDNPQLIYEQDYYGRTALISFIEQQNLQMVKLLIDMGSNVFLRQAEGISPMQLAIKRRWAEGVRAMLNVYYIELPPVPVDQ